MIKMPPQAYTKEVLTAAFDWLSGQPEYVRQKITSSDDLVGLYLKSTRLKQDFNKDLSSAKNFRNELQDLAQNLKQFEEKEEPPAKPAPTRTMSIPMPKENLIYSGSNPSEKGFETASQQQMMPPQAPEPHHSNQEMMSSSVVNVPVPTPATSAVGSARGATKIASEGEILFRLDQKTLAALNLAKDRLNLSSDSEALRVLVSLGEKHLKKLFTSED